MRIDGISAAYSSSTMAIGGRVVASATSASLTTFSAETSDSAAELLLGDSTTSVPNWPTYGSPGADFPWGATSATFQPVEGLTSDQRAVTTQAPPPEFFEHFQSAFEKLAAAWQTATESAETGGEGDDPAVRDALVETLGIQHVEWTERVHQFSQQYEKDKEGYYSVETTVQFASILNQAYDRVPEGSAREFLLTLSIEQLHVVQVQHALADPIDPGSLTEEGAFNLLLPHGFKVDPNHDGILETGISRGLTFPPLDAPQAVRDAWLAATASLSEMDIATYQLSLWGGLQSQSLSTTDPNAYREVTQRHLEMLDAFRGYLSPGQYERDFPFYSQLLQELDTRSSDETA